MNREASRLWSRRRFLQASSAAVTGGLVVGAAGCDGAEKAGGSGGGTLQWWDHYNPLQALHKKMFAEWSKKSNTPVDYTFYQGKKLAEALQLAKQSGQLPDVHSNSPSIGIPVPSLVESGWFQPLNLDEAAVGRIPKQELVEGIHLFDGKLYCFPIFNSRWHSASLFVNKVVYEKAGLDPANPPGTWDEFRAACRAVRQKVGGETYGFMDTEPGATKLGAHAQAAGFEGSWQGQLYRTGEYALDSDAWLNVIEVNVALQKDKLVFPGSYSGGVKTRAARGRWAAGAAAFFIDGPWGPGVVVQNFGEFADDTAPGQILLTDATASRSLHAGVGGGAFYISAESSQADAANELLARFTTKEYYLGIAKSMGQPPLDMSAVAEAEGVHPNYRQIITWFADQVSLQPTPIIRNPEVAKVLAEQKPVTPDLRAIVTGVYSGDVPDARKALKQLSDKLNAELDRAIAAAKQKGAKVSRDDFAFPDWQPGKDYTYQK